MSCFATCEHGIASRRRPSIHYQRMNWPRSFDHGKTEFDEIYIEPEASPPIVLDGKADDVFDGIIKKRVSPDSLLRPDLVAAWRH